MAGLPLMRSPNIVALAKGAGRKARIDAVKKAA